MYVGDVNGFVHVCEYIQIRDSGDAVLLSDQGQYWRPPSDPFKLYDQLAKRMFREIQRKQIRYTTIGLFSISYVSTN